MSKVIAAVVQARPVRDDLSGSVERAVGTEETILIAELDLTRIREESMTLDVSGHYARPDVLEFNVRRDTRRS